QDSYQGIASAMPQVHRNQTPLQGLNPLRTFLSTLAGQVFHLFLIDLKPFGFFHVPAQVGNEQAEQIVLLAFEERLADIVLLFGEFLFRRRLFFEQLSDHAIAAGSDRPANLARRQRKDRTRASHGADVGNLSIGQNQIARLHRRTQIFGSFLQIMLSLGAVGEFLRLLLQQKTGALVLELALDLRTNLFERGRGRGPYGEQLENHVALRDLHNIGRGFVGFVEDGIHKLRIRSQSGQAIGSAEEFGGDGSLTLGGGGRVESGSTRLAEQSVRCRFGGVRRFLLLYLLFNLTLHLGESLEMSLLLVFDADDMEAVTALHQIAGLTLAE